MDLAALIAPWAARVPTRTWALGPGVVSGAAELLAPALPAGRWLVVADATTWELAGTRVATDLARRGRYAGCHRVEPRAGQRSAVADGPQVGALSERLRRAGPAVGAVVAVGSGTVNDVAKAACHDTGRPYAVVATAPSMNGYTSAIAALSAEGVKITHPCSPPVGFLGDLDLLASAPSRMIAAGLGDLCSRPVSQADWLLSRRLLGTPYSDEAAAVLELSARLLEGVSARLAARDPAAVAALTAALCLSGAAMAIAGSSAPASGGEHLISHYLDMTAPEHTADLHGCQVGVATLVSAALYARLADLAPSAIDPEARAAACPGWPERAARIARHFGDLAPALQRQARPGHPTAEEVRLRLGRLRDEWSELRAELRPCLEPTVRVRRALVEAGAPVTFAALGVDPRRARAAVLHAKDIRNRYTILHLADELGHLEDWAEGALTGVA